MLGIVRHPDARVNLNSQLFSIKKDITEMKTSMENLDKLTQTVTVPKRIMEKIHVHEHAGHTFKLKVPSPSATCFHCHDALFSGNSTFECTICRLTCHKFCVGSITATCHEYLQLKRAMKWYFMTNDESDKTRWVTGLDCVHGNVQDLSAKAKGADIDSMLLI